jgi:prepilin-type N-terminal cleavage/methylation domain-containing protein
MGIAEANAMHFLRSETKRRHPARAGGNWDEFARCGHGPNAFTIVELVIVLLIMSVLAAAATPVFVNSLLFHRVESAARRVKADLELARRTARLTSTKQTLTVIGLKYTITPDVVNLDRPDQPYTVDFSTEPYRLDILAANFNSLTQVDFDGYGAPSSGGTIILQARNHQCTVTLDGATGQVTITSNHSGSRTAKTLGI